MPRTGVGFLASASVRRQRHRDSRHRHHVTAQCRGVRAGESAPAPDAQFELAGGAQSSEHSLPTGPFCRCRSRCPAVCRRPARSARLGGEPDPSLGLPHVDRQDSVAAVRRQHDRQPAVKRLLSGTDRQRHDARTQLAEGEDRENQRARWAKVHTAHDMSVGFARPRSGQDLGVEQQLKSPTLAGGADGARGAEGSCDRTRRRALAARQRRTNATGDSPVVASRSLTVRDNTTATWTPVHGVAASQGAL
jgi:hypothetical protein